jgi:hypothetical protein
MNVGYTIKPSLANSSVALKVSMASGIKYLDRDGFLILASWFLMLRQVEQNSFFTFLAQMLGNS